MKTPHSAQAEAAPAKKPRKKRRSWRRSVILSHRYLGYLFAGTTVVYAVSGLALNHMDDWNPNFAITRHHKQMAPLAQEDLSEQEAQKLFTLFDLKASFNPDNVFYPDESTIEVLLHSNEKLRINTESWQVEHEVVRRRPVLHLFNFLHLNSAKKFWTWYADLYAVALLLLAISGLLMKKGKQGLWGEAGIWTLAGMVLPLILAWLYYQV